MRTRIFKSGNSLAVRIPKELAIAGVSEEVEIERAGNTLMLRPAQQKRLAGVGEILPCSVPVSCPKDANSTTNETGTAALHGARSRAGVR